MPIVDIGSNACVTSAVMVDRPLWTQRVYDAFKQAPVVWLGGVGRAGKTALAKTLKSRAYVDCSLPESTKLLQDPVKFFGSIRSGLVVIDNIHHLTIPSRPLQMAVDGFPKLRVLATGLSTVPITRRFQEALKGRHEIVELLPVLAEEAAAFGVTDLTKRLRLGGLPPALAGAGADFYSDWLQSYFASEAEAFFRIHKQEEFLHLTALVLSRSGSKMDMSRLAREVGISNPTAPAWINALTSTGVARVVPALARSKRQEAKTPKLYGFDTGFVCCARGWNTLRPEDCGGLWEHLVFDTLASVPVADIRCWAQPKGRAVDFAVPRGGGRVDAIECVWSMDDFQTDNLKSFRGYYPRGRNYVVSPEFKERCELKQPGLRIVLLPIEDLRGEFAPGP